MELECGPTQSDLFWCLFVTPNVYGLLLLALPDQINPTRDFTPAQPSLFWQLTHSFWWPHSEATTHVTVCDLTILLVTWDTNSASDWLADNILWWQKMESLALIGPIFSSLVTGDTSTVSDWLADLVTLLIGRPQSQWSPTQVSLGG